MVPLGLLLAGQRFAYQVHGIIAGAEAGRTRRAVAALTFQSGDFQNVGSSDIADWHIPDDGEGVIPQRVNPLVNMLAVAPTLGPLPVRLLGRRGSLPRSMTRKKLPPGPTSRKRATRCSRAQIPESITYQPLCQKEAPHECQGFRADVKERFAKFGAPRARDEIKGKLGDALIKGRPGRKRKAEKMAQSSLRMPEEVKHRVRILAARGRWEMSDIVIEAITLAHSCAGCS